MKKLKLVTMFFILVIFLNCKNNSSEKEIKQENAISLNTNNIAENKIDIDSIIDNYAKQLSNSDIRIVDYDICAQTEINSDMFDQGISTYAYDSIKTNSSHGKIAGDLNNDGQTDYIANYSCDNCWGGIGSGNYLSNCFFLTSRDNQITVNEAMTNDFKQKLIDAIKKDFGEEYSGVKPEKEMMINGIEFTEIKNQIAYGTFNINTDACQGSPFPCVEGTFEYDANNKTVKMLGKINQQYFDQSN